MGVRAETATPSTAAPTIATTNRATDRANRPTARGCTMLSAKVVDIIAYVTCCNYVAVT